MSYGMHDYLAEKAIRNSYNYGIQKRAGILEDVRRGLSIDLNEEHGKLDETRKRGEEVMHDNGMPMLNQYGVPIDENGEPEKGLPYPVDSNGAPTPTLRERILYEILSNKYALGGAGALGAAGAAAGAFASKENRLRNALIGGGIGTILGGVAGHIADRYV